MTEPSRRDRFRPAELIGLSLVIAVFGGLVTLMSTRDLALALIVFGIIFILTLVTIALLVMAVKPDDAEKQDLAQQKGVLNPPEEKQPRKQSQDPTAS
jgi:membrane protein implicated in regulation of membrane protease activity